MTVVIHGKLVVSDKDTEVRGYVKDSWLIAANDLSIIFAGVET